MQKYLRLSSYENAMKVIKFIRENFEGQYKGAQITEDCIIVDVQDWDKLETFIKTLTTNYEISDIQPYIIRQEIIDKFPFL